MFDPVSIGLGGVISSVGGALTGSATAGMRGKAHGRFMRNAFPGTNPWEQLGSSQGAGGSGAESAAKSMDAAAERKNRLEIAKIGAQAQVEAARTSATGSFVSSPNLRWNKDLVAVATELMPWLDVDKDGFVIGVQDRFSQHAIEQGKLEQLTRSATADLESAAANTTSAEASMILAELTKEFKNWEMLLKTSDSATRVAQTILGYIVAFKAKDILSSVGTGGAGGLFGGGGKPSPSNPRPSGPRPRFSNEPKGPRVPGKREMYNPDTGEVHTGGKMKTGTYTMESHEFERGWNDLYHQMVKAGKSGSAIDSAATLQQVISFLRKFLK